MSLPPIFEGVVLLYALRGSIFGRRQGFKTPPPFPGGIFSPLVAVPVSPDAIRNTALAALMSLLVGLIGSVIGGWMASGEPMTLTHYRTRQPMYAPRREF